MTNKETLRKVGLFSLKKRRLQFDLTYVFSYPLGENKEDGARHFLEVHSKIIKLQGGKFQGGVYVEILHSEGRQPFVAKR